MIPYPDILEPLNDDASFLRVLRGITVNQPNCYLDDLNQLDWRIETKLSALMSQPEKSWDLCKAALDIPQVGELFTAGVLAFRSLEVNKIQLVVETGLATDEGFKGLVSALGWLPGRLCHSWIKKFLVSKDPNHKYLAVAACSVRREDPREYLTNIFQHPNCLAHDKLYARALRLVGELKRRDLFHVLTTAMQVRQPNILFWATWSAAILGDKSALEKLQPFVLQPNPHQARAIDITFRALPLETARAWINQLAKDPAQVRQVIRASANLGDPHAVNWLIAQMRVPALSRLAGEAFTTITGIDLDTHGLALDALPDLDALNAVPAADNDPDNASMELDEDDSLAFPDISKVAAVWQKYHQRFIPGQRYFMGQTITSEHLHGVYASANQRQRRMAALELALLQPTQFLLNHAIKEEWEPS